MRRAGRLQQKLRAIAGGIGHQHTAAGNHLALRRGPGADARVERAAVEVGVALGGADLLHHALDAHHALQLHPVELQRAIGVAGQLLPLARVVVGVPDDAAGAVALDQHHPCARAQVAAHGGQCHRIGLGDLGRDGLLQPLIKLLQGVGMGGVFAEFSAFVAFAKVGD